MTSLDTAVSWDGEKKVLLVYADQLPPFLTDPCEDDLTLAGAVVDWLNQVDRAELPTSLTVVLLYPAYTLENQRD